MNLSLFKDRLLLTVLATSSAMLLLTVVKPLGFDNALMQSMALDVFRYGREPYTGVWIHDFPGIIYLHVLSMAVFGTSDVSLRIFDCCIQILFAVFLYRFFQRWLSPKMSALSSMLYIAYYVSAGSLLLSERDVYGAMTIVLSVYCLRRAREVKVNRSKTNLWIITAGLLAGLHLLMRPMAIIYLAILAGSLFISDNGKLRWNALPRVFEMVVAGLLPLGIMLYHLSRTPGALGEMYKQVVLWNADLYAPIANGWLALIEELGRRALLLPFAIYGYVKLRKNSAFFLNRRLERWERSLYWALILSSLIIALGMQKYFSYHFAPFCMLIVPISAIGIVRFSMRLQERHRRTAILLSFILCTFITYYPKSPIAFGSALLEGKNPWEATYDVQFPDSLAGGKTEREAAQYLQLSKNKEGLAEICSMRPHLRLHCGHPSATRYDILDALAMRTDFTNEGTPQYTNYQKDWQWAYLDSLCTKKPRFIVLARSVGFMYLDDAYTDCLHFLPGFDSLLSASYRYDTAFGDYQIYRIRSDIQ